MMAILFDDSNDYIAVPTGATLPNGDNAHTILVRFRYSADGHLYDQGLGSLGKECNLYIANSGDRISWDHADRHLQVTGLSLNDGHWHTVMARHRPSPRSKEIWVDGVQKGSASHTLNVQDNAARRIGADSAATPGSFFGGWMEDFRIFASKYVGDNYYFMYHAGSRLPIGGEDVWYSMEMAAGVTGWDSQTLSTSNILPNLKGDGEDGVPTNGPIAQAGSAERM